MRRFTRAVIMCVLLTFSATQAYAQLGVGLKVGPAFLLQDPAEIIDGKIGPAIGADIFYGFNDFVRLGFGFGWEMHGTETGDVDMGNASTISLIPFVEIHPVSNEKVSPYFSLGIGYNINFFNPDDAIVDAAFEFLGLAYDVEVDDTFALRVAGGLGILLTDRVSVNIEVGWKYNKGEARETLNGITATEGDFDLGAITAMVGFRYFFGTQ